ncbi:MAG TPA: M20/M25/M40 family metallo-hydrolase [Candidatus Saccharimonadales bacterium]|nr:M20/M25/M40 family metallo-hydrolase [Candidatus Saccharimonadales bacterium]
MSLIELRRLAAGVDPEPIAELATRMLEIWSPPGAESEIAAVAHRALLDAGAEDVTLDEDVPGSPSVIAWLRGVEPGPTIQWHGHLDAIRTPQGPIRRDGDVIHGRGAADMKGALAAMVEAVKLLRAAGFPDRGNVLITFHGLHEEGGSVPLHRLIERGIHGDAVIIGELGSGRELVTNSRGLTFWDLIVRRPGEGIHETVAASDLVHPVRVGGLLLDRLLDLADGLAAGHVEPRGSLFVGRFTSGDYYNRVPQEALLSGTRRHHADSSLAAVRAQLVELAARVAADTGATIEPEIHGLIEAYEIDPDERVARALRRAHHELTGERMVAVGSRATGNAGDFVHEAGIPVVYYGCAYPTAHSDDEQVFVPELARVAAGYALASAYFLSDDAEIAAPPLESAG